MSQWVILKQDLSSTHIIHIMSIIQAEALWLLHEWTMFVQPMERCVWRLCRVDGKTTRIKLIIMYHHVCVQIIGHTLCTSLELFYINNAKLH